MSEKKLQAVVDAINKKYGKGAIMRLGDAPAVDVETFSTGSLGLDIATGIGGFPRGRVSSVSGPESSGKTSLTIHAIADCQKKGYTAAFIDVEHAFDPKYARNLGVNTDDLIFSQPNSAEEALNIAEELVKSGDIDLLIIDSIAALVPQQEIEGEMGDAKLGLQARLMSQAMRKLTPIVHKNNCALILLNQIREKIGVMFGCFPYASKVRLADGSSIQIGKIVNQKLDVEVLSWNFETNKLEPKKVIGWYNNGKYEKLYTVETLSPHKSGTIKLTVADDHTFITKDEERRLSELSVGDLILTPSKNYLNKDQQSLILGGYLGDGSVRVKNGVTGSYREAHGKEQNDYCIWKSYVLGEFIGSYGYTNDKFWFQTLTSPELSIYSKGKNKGLSSISDVLISKIDLISLAIWYLDDGSFGGFYEKWGNGKSSIYAKNLPIEYKKKVIEHVENELGIRLGISKQGFICSGKNNYVFHEKIAPYVPECMSYKIHPKLRHLCGTYQYNNKCDIKDVLIEVPILDIYETQRNNGRSGNKFDIEVEGNSNYFVSDVLVHNSPETEPGGNAIKFYASLRLDIRRSGSGIKDKEGVMEGNSVKVKVVKNKLAPPFRVAQFDIIYGKGVSLSGEVVDLAADLNIIQKSGAWYSYNDAKIGQGRENTKQFLEDNPEVLEEVMNKIKESYQ